MPALTAWPGRLTRKAARAVATPPRPRDPILILAELTWLVPLLALLGYAGHLLDWSPDFTPATLRLAATALFVPALGEELLFRCLPMPRPSPGAAFPWRSATIALALFVLWHPLQAPIFGGPWAGVVLNPWFLLCLAALGTACTRLYWKTGSIWPSTLLHWLIVAVWKLLLGGPSPWTG